jgi:lipoprotein-anchoring transpeptidase ErfK/SrfK
MLTRRDFLKLSGAALLGILLSNLPGGEAQAASLPAQGRVLYTRMKVRAEPSFSADQVGSLVFDNLVDIAEAVLGGAPEDANHLWYRLEAGGYVHSGGIQLVQTLLNETVLDVPEAGVVGEVTVPYADSLWALNRSPVAGPRLYYKTTHWVNALVSDQRDGSLWYKCYDNLWKSHYYTRPEWVRIYAESELAPISPQVPDDEKHIQVVLDEQMLYAYERAVTVYAARTSTGQDGFETPPGWYRAFHKRPTAHMSGGYDIYSTFDLPGVPWDTYISESGIAIHGTFWHNDFGTRHSHGCINLTPDAARWIYRWTNPPVPPGEKVVLVPGSGTRVWVRQSQTS